jgi:hypothetical protein
MENNALVGVVVRRDAVFSRVAGSWGNCRLTCPLKPAQLVSKD